ncbi:MAG: competence/damage-inducible protein A [Candidatus Methylomirabilales bacterium]
MAKTAGILIIGNEVLSGKVVDQNSPYLVRELRALGVEVKRITTIPDEVPVIAQEVQALAEQYDLVFTTGGVGPTHDDVTIAAIATAFGRGVVRHPLLEDVLRQHYGQGITAAQLRMAEMPEGGELVGEGDMGFPVVVFRNVYIFPGIPEAVRRKFERIRERFREQPFVLRRVFLRCDEGQIAGDLNGVMSRFPALQLGSYPILHNPEHNVELTLESKSAEYVERALRFLLNRLSPQVIVRIE